MLHKSPHKLTIPLGLAKTIGVDNSILLYNFAQYIAYEGCRFDNTWWACYSIKDIHENMGFEIWSPSKISRQLANLEALKLVKRTKAFNTTKTLHTYWYTLTQYAINLLMEAEHPEITLISNRLLNLSQPATHPEISLPHVREKYIYGEATTAKGDKPSIYLSLAEENHYGELNQFQFRQHHLKAMLFLESVHQQLQLPEPNRAGNLLLDNLPHYDLWEESDRSTTPEMIWITAIRTFQMKHMSIANRWYRDTEFAGYFGTVYFIIIPSDYYRSELTAAKLYVPIKQILEQYSKKDVSICYVPRTWFRDHPHRDKAYAMHDNSYEKLVASFD